MADFVLNPETNEVSRQVVSYERVERAQLEAEVSQTEANVNAQNERVAGLEAELEAARQDQAAAASAFEEAKSNVEAYDSVAPEVTGTDAGSEEGSSEVENSTEVAESPEDGESVDNVVNF